MGVATKLKKREPDLGHFDENSQISEKQRKKWKDAFDLYQQYVMRGEDLQCFSERVESNVLREVQEYENRKNRSIWKRILSFIKGDSIKHE